MERELKRAKAGDAAKVADLEAEISRLAAEVERLERLRRAAKPRRIRRGNIPQWQAKYDDAPLAGNGELALVADRKKAAKTFADERRASGATRSATGIVCGKREYGSINSRQPGLR